ncbi:MAG: ATP-binding protein [Chloroflexota bacterium]
MSTQITPLKILLNAFPGIPRVEAEELVNSGQVYTYPPDTILTHEDAFESTFYIILEGQVRVTKVVSHDETRLLKTLEAGDFFGEMAIIQEAPRAATVTTAEPTTVLEIRKDAFNNLLRRSASISLAMVKEVSRRLRTNDAMAIEDLRLKAGELAAAYQQLAEQDYARREFLTTIAHELRTPLTAANGFLHMLQMGLLQGRGLDNAEQRAALENVSRNVQHIVTLVNDILFLQEMDLILPGFSEVDLRAVLESVILRYRNSAQESQVRLWLTIPSDLPPVSGDAKSLERAFAALVDNAIKFSPDGGDVEIIASQSDSQVIILIRDHGIGIPDHIMPRIFNRFFHVDEINGRVFRGIGLGLSIARQVIEQHQGRISVESQFGKGATFTVFLDAVKRAK